MLKLIIIWTGIFLLPSQALAQPVMLKSIDLNELNLLCSPESDKVVIVNFWASWCGPGIEELPYFKKLKKEMPSIKVVLVNLDFENDVERNVSPVLIKGQYSSLENLRLTGLKADDWMPLADWDWSGAISATLILASGKKKFIEQKFENYSALKAAIQQL